MITIRTYPADGVEKNIDDSAVVESVENPNKIKTTYNGANSLNVDQPSSWKMTNVNITTNPVKMYVVKSNINDVNQNVQTFTPLTN